MLRSEQAREGGIVTLLLPSTGFPLLLIPPLSVLTAPLDNSARRCFCFSLASLAVLPASSRLTELEALQSFCQDKCRTRVVS